MSKKGPAVQETISPNLIPMIDIMFLMLLFFMLGADMGQREFEDVRLPKASSVKEDKKENRGLLTINVYHLYGGPSGVQCAEYNHGQVCREERHWRVGIKGLDYTDPEKLGKFLQREADSMRGTDPRNPHVSEKKVQIRADDTAPYGLAQRAMNVCAKAGIYKIEVGAARPADNKRKI